MTHHPQCISQNIDGLKAFSDYSRAEAVKILGTPDRIEIQGEGINGLDMSLVYGEDKYTISFTYDEDGNDVSYEELSKGDKGYDNYELVLDKNGFYHIPYAIVEDKICFIVVDSKWFDRNKGWFSSFQFKSKGHSVNHNGNVMRVGDNVSSLFSMKAEMIVTGKVKRFITVEFDNGDGQETDYCVKYDDKGKISEISGLSICKKYTYHHSNNFKRCSMIYIGENWGYKTGCPLYGILANQNANFILSGPGANTCILAVPPYWDCYRVTFDSKYYITGIEKADKE